MDLIIHITLLLKKTLGEKIQNGKITKNYLITIINDLCALFIAKLRKI